MSAILLRDTRGAMYYRLTYIFLNYCTVWYRPPDNINVISFRKPVIFSLVLMMSVFVIRHIHVLTQVVNQPTRWVSDQC